MTAPDATVVIPTRNRWPMLQDAVRSALDQRDVSIEVVVVDDGSTDATAQLAGAWEDPRVTVIRNERSVGVASARNMAAERASAPWIAFLDDDDLWAPTYLATVLGAGLAAGAGVVCCARWTVDGARVVTGAELLPHPERLLGLLRSRNAIGGPSSVVCRRDLLAETGGYDPRLHALADWELWIRLLVRSTATVVAEPLVAYTRYAGNMHLADPEAILRERDVLFGVLWPHPEAPSDVEHVTRWIARESSDHGRRRESAALWLRAWRGDSRLTDLVRAAQALLVPPRPHNAVYAPPAWLRPYQRAQHGS